MSNQDIIEAAQTQAARELMAEQDALYTKLRSILRLGTGVHGGHQGIARIVSLDEDSHLVLVEEHRGTQCLSGYWMTVQDGTTDGIGFEQADLGMLHLISRRAGGAADRHAATYAARVLGVQTPGSEVL